MSVDPLKRRRIQAGWRRESNFDIRVQPKSVGLSEDDGDQEGEMEERNSGQSSIAFDSVFKRIGR